jgi:cytochrome c oxidase subunit II
MLRKHRSLFALVAAVAALGASQAQAAWTLNMTQGVTSMSGEIYSLHMSMFWWCVAIAVFVFGWMIWSLVAFRKSNGAVPDTTLVHSTKAEIIWTIIPVVILVVLAIPAARTLIALDDSRGSELTVKVTGYQWKWGYDYLDSGVSFFSTLSRDSNEARQLQSHVDVHAVHEYLRDVDHPLVVPTGTKVRLLLTAQDVIHAWWVPQLAIKKDAIPGFVNELWFQIDADKPGLYRGQCVELCGRDHSAMPIVVEAKSPADFKAWLKEQQDAQQQTRLLAAAKTG